MHYARSIRSFDLKKLYTNLPPNKVIDKISDLINKCFTEKEVDYIFVNDRFKAS